MHKKRTEIVENKFLDIRKEKKIKFEDFADEFFDQYCKVHNALDGQASVSNIRALKRYFAGKYLQEITPQSIEKFKAERLEEVNPATVNRALACLKSLFNRAIDWEKYDKANPVKKVKFLKENNHRLRFLEKEEITKLINNCGEQLKPIVILAVNTGMRRGEILNLKWKDIDLKRELIYLYKTKSGEKREIPINAQVKDAINNFSRNPESEYVFCRKDSLHIYDVRKPFCTAVKKSGLTNFRFHDLRHTFGSQLVMSGVDLNTTRELLGHKSLEMTLRYAHLSPNHKKRAVDVLSNSLGTCWAPDQFKEDKVKSGVSAIHSNTIS